MFVFLASCQINQSVDLIKDKLFSNEDDIEISKKPINKVQANKSIDKTSDVVLEKKQNEFLENDDSLKEKVESKKINLKTKNNASDELSFKEMGKARDTDSKIISFFTKIFDSDDQIKETKDIKNDVNGANLDKPESYKPRVQQNLDKDLINEEEVSNKSLSIQKEKVDDVLETFKGQEKDEIFNDDDSPKVNADEGEKRDLSSKEEGFAFLQFKKPKIQKDEISKSDNVVGLLLPLTGEKSSAGNLVINSLRYSMLLKPNQLNFKIFDTQSNPDGAIDAAKNGIDDGVKTFIGPIFSDETKTVRNFFKNKGNLTFFSLSPDLSNISDNVIVSGQNPEEQVSCIVQHLAGLEAKKILLIYHADKYGHVIRNSVDKFLDSFGLSSSSYVDVLQIEENLNLNNEIKKLSNFESRKKRLKNEIQNIKKDMIMDKNLKKNKIKSLERKLTLDSPFDSIIIASEGDKLLEILSHLAFYDINSENTKIYGTGLWEDSIKKDNVFNGTFFVTSLKQKNIDFIKNYRNVFSRDPISFNFHIHDLIELVQSFTTLSNDEIESKVFYGEFSNSKISSGSLKREIFLRKIKKNQLTEDVFNCSLDVI